MNYFEKVSKFADVDFNLPVRKTASSAGYDFEVAEDIVIPSYKDLESKLDRDYKELVRDRKDLSPIGMLGLEDVAKITKITKCKPTLVSTGVKCQLDKGYYLELSVRSSTPLKYWLILANGIGIIDADYYNNPDNEGEIFFQLINLSPWPIQLKRGDVVGQGVIKKYHTTADDISEGKRIGGFGSTSKEIETK